MLLEISKTDYLHIDVMDGKFVSQDTYHKMIEYSNYIKRISNLPLDIHLMVEDVETGIEVFSADEPNIITFHLEACKNKEEVMRFISKAKALIVPSQWYEGFPMTIAESLSMGVPVIAGDIGNLSTIIESEKNGLLFKYYDKQEFKDKIQMLNNNKSLEEQLRLGARESINNKYNERINYKLLIDIYENCSRRNI